MINISKRVIYLEISRDRFYNKEIVIKILKILYKVLKLNRCLILKLLLYTLRLYIERTVALYCSN